MLYLVYSAQVTWPSSQYKVTPGTESITVFLESQRSKSFLLFHHDGQHPSELQWGMRGSDKQACQHKALPQLCLPLSGQEGGRMKENVGKQRRCRKNSLIMELWGTLYLQSAYFNRDDQALPGFAAFFWNASEEEHRHAVRRRRRMTCKKSRKSGWQERGRCGGKFDNVTKFRKIENDM